MVLVSPMPNTCTDTHADKPRTLQNAVAHHVQVQTVSFLFFYFFTALLENIWKTKRNEEKDKV